MSESSGVRVHSHSMPVGYVGATNAPMSLSYAITSLIEASI
jgi:hypothetical protein